MKENGRPTGLYWQKEMEALGRKPCCSVTLSTTNITCKKNGIEPETALRQDSKHLSNGTAKMFFLKSITITGMLIIP
jgi:hypothetical protein